MPHAGVEFTFGDRGGGVVWIEPQPDGKVRVLHNGRPGPAFQEVSTVSLSPDGLHHAYGRRVGEQWQLVMDGTEGPVLPDLGYVAYSPDSAHIAYSARVGETFQFFVDGKVRRSGPADYLGKSFSAESKKLVLLEPADGENARLVVLDVASQASWEISDHVTQWTTSADKTRCAAVARVDGGERVLVFEVDRPERVRRGRTYERVASVDFGSDGYPLGYYALRKGETLFVVEEDEIPLEKGEALIGGAAPRWGERGFGALVKLRGKVTFRQFMTGAAPPEPAYEDAYGLTYGGDGRLHAYAARRGASWFVVANGKEGPPFEVVRPPEFSPDGRFLVYRARREAKRFVVIADPDARTLRELPAYEQVFDVHFTADGRSIAYGVKDGRELAWKVEPLP
jgi:hypothetical protein